MYLVDTSVWIDYFRNIDNKATQLLTRLLDEEILFGITGLIYQEILQGAADKNDFKNLQTFLSTQEFFHLKDDIESYEAAAEIFYNARRKGITIRSTIDCLIAQIAIDNKLTLLHNDKDYIQIAKVATQLKLAY
jgi:predicted nucleic acid-binding protein